MRVLVVEDDEEMAEAIALGLRHAGTEADVATDGPSGLALALDNDYDVIVLDRDLPGVRGDEICARLVIAASWSKILMLSGAAATEDLVAGFAQGADDYLTKPFDFPVLVARLGALTRRTTRHPPVLRHGDLVVDTAQRLAFRDGRALHLCPKEFGVLETLLVSRGRIVSAEELLERVWDEFADPFTKAVKTTISRLRGKLGDPPVIATAARSGYRI
jgi:DNA-binding response OmpR family regulator